MQELVTATADVQTAKTKAGSSIAVSQAAADKAIKGILQLVKLLLASKYPEIQSRTAEWTAHEEAIKSSGTDAATLQKASSGLLKAVELMKSSLETKIKSDEEFLSQQGIISTLLATLDQKQQSAKDLEQLAQRLAAILQVVESQRKAYVKGILSSISTDVESMYTRMHPNEGLGGIRLYLRQNVQGSLEFDGDFQGAKEVPPQAYYSDAHMDTLGICVFLAMTKLFNDDNTVLSQRYVREFT
jgi:hypothetical protein